MMYFALTELNSMLSTLVGMLHPPEASLAQLMVSPASSMVTSPATEPILLALMFNRSREKPVISSTSSIALSLSSCSSTMLIVDWGIGLFAKVEHPRFLIIDDVGEAS